jgi:FAD binding domain
MTPGRPHRIVPAAANAAAYEAEVSEMQRRVVLKGLAALPLSVVGGPALGGAVQPVGHVRPGEPGWPDPAEWARLRRRVGGRLMKVTSPFAACTPDPASPGCTELFGNLGDPFYIGDSVALTQTLGWTDAWTSQASAYAVLAQDSADVAAAVNFARTHRVRLVVKGGGHSYLGGSNAPDSLLIWTRPNLRAIQLQDRLCPGGPPAWSPPSRR